MQSYRHVLRQGPWKIVLSVAIYLTLILNAGSASLGYCSLQFASPRLNVLVPALLLLLAALSLIGIFQRSHTGKRTLAATILLPLALVSTLLGVLAVYTDFDVIVTDKNRDVVLVSAIPLHGSQVRAYVWKGNMLVADTLVIQQEQPLPFGLVWITRLYERYAASDVQMTVICAVSFLLQDAVGKQKR